MRLFTKLGFLTVAMLLMSSINSTAQSFEEGNSVINAGIGVGTYYPGGAGNLGLPLGAGFEYGITNLEVGSIGVGGDFGFVSGSGLTIIYVGGKASYHFNDLIEIDNEDVDLYGGLGIYYRQFNYDGSTWNYGSGLYGGFHVGGRYFFSDNLGGYAELGNSWAWLNLGLVFKL